MGAAAQRQADWVVLTSDNPRSESPAHIIHQVLQGTIAGATVRAEPDRAAAIALGLMAAGAFTAAMDALLEIVMRDKAWNGELARKTYVAILEILTKPQPKAVPGADKAKGTLELTGHAAVASSDPVLDQYRRKLSMALF